jgi:hypothetical protein
MGVSTSAWVSAPVGLSTLKVQGSPASANAPRCSTLVASSMPWLERRDHRSGHADVVSLRGARRIRNIVEGDADRHRFEGASLAAVERPA